MPPSDTHLRDRFRGCLLGLAIGDALGGKFEAQSADGIRDGPDPATGDFFICISDQPELDFGGKRNPDGQGFAAFGRVVKGMDVVKKIQGAPAKGQELDPVVKIIRVRKGQ